MRSVATLALVLSAACGVIRIGGNGGEPQGTTQVLAGATFDRAWRATIESFEELRLPIDNLDRQSGVVTTDWILIRSPRDYMDCEGGARRNAEGRFNIFVREVADGVRVTVNVTFRAEDDTGRRVVCESEGEYERQILRRIRNKVG